MTIYSKTLTNSKSKTSLARTSSPNTLITAALISVLTLTPTIVNAQNYDLVAQDKTVQHNEEIGFGTGMVIGAILGGPVGAFITGVAGHLIVKNSNAENKIETISTAYEKEKQGNEMALAIYQEKITGAEQAYQEKLVALQSNYQKASLLQAQNLLMSLQFSTGSSEIKPHYKEQVAALANIVQQSPELRVELSGYTDKQGSDELNQALSLARVNAIKNALIDHGVEADKINLFAYGEQQPVVASNEKEVSFYDRRVVIKLKSEMVAVTPLDGDSTQVANNF